MAVHPADDAPDDFRGAAILAQKQGCDVFVSDSGKIKENYEEELRSKGIEWEQGSHNREVYGELLGYDAARVAALERAGVV